MVFFLFLIGVCVGSFLNVLADRLPKGEDVIKSRSHCDYCKHKLLWYELIPLLSFMLQKGRTGCCHKRLSFQYPLSEFVTGIGFVLLSILPFPHGFVMQSSFLIPYSLFLIIFSSFIVIFLSDLKYEIIPMEMVLIGFLTAFVLIFFNVTMGRFNDVTIANHALSAICAAFFFFSFWFFTKGKAMGDGDVYLAALIGLLLGFPNIVISLYVAFLTGAFVGVILVLRRKKSLKAHIPFGPFLILSYGITLLWADTILKIWRLLL